MFERANLMHVIAHWRVSASLDFATLRAGMPDAKKKYTPRRTVPAPRAMSRIGTLLFTFISKKTSKKEGAGRDRCMPLMS